MMISCAQDSRKFEPLAVRRVEPYRRCVGMRKLLGCTGVVAASWGMYQKAGYVFSEVISGLTLGVQELPYIIL